MVAGLNFIQSGHIFCYQRSLDDHVTNVKKIEPWEIGFYYIGLYMYYCIHLIMTPLKEIL